jgi:predicted nuclease of restriction endonuclease-like (RecB) superfamily
MKTSQEVLPADYSVLLAEVKERIRSAQLTALRAINRELVGLYWDIGRAIVGRQQEGKSWGKAVVERLAADLRAEFPGVGGFSASNLWRMKAFYEAYAGSERLAPLVREIAWSHNLIVLERRTNPRERELCLRMTGNHGGEES